MFKPDQHNPFSGDLEYLGNYSMTTAEQAKDNGWLQDAYNWATGSEPQLKEGDTGKSVLELHKLLLEALDPKKTGWAATFVGGDEFRLSQFGRETTSKVKYFQAAQGLAVDGIVGKNTWAALHRVSGVVEKQKDEGYFEAPSSSPAQAPTTSPTKAPEFQESDQSEDETKKKGLAAVTQHELFVPVTIGTVAGGILLFLWYRRSRS